MKKAATMILLALLSAPVTSAGTLYTWTDANGIKQFSDQPPPQDVQEFKVIEGTTDSAEPGEREGYRQMIEEIEQQNRQKDIEQKQKAEEKAAEQRQKEQAERQARMEAERRRLQELIDALNNRGLSPTFTEGMRRAQIEAIQSQIDQLNRPTGNGSNER